MIAAIPYALCFKQPSSVSVPKVFLQCSGFQLEIGRTLSTLYSNLTQLLPPLYSPYLASFCPLFLQPSRAAVSYVLALLPAEAAASLTSTGALEASRRGGSLPSASTSASASASAAVTEASCASPRSPSSAALSDASYTSIAASLRHLRVVLTHALAGSEYLREAEERRERGDEEDEEGEEEYDEGEWEQVRVQVMSGAVARADREVSVAQQRLVEAMAGSASLQRQMGAVREVNRMLHQAKEMGGM